MEIDKRGRTELKQYFVKNAIPTEKNFAELIDGMLSHKDDGIAKLSGNPLSIEASGDDTSQKKAIHFYKSFADPDPTWVLSLNPRQNPSDPATAKPGFSIGDSAGNSRLFIDRGTGNVGIGTITPLSTLTLAGANASLRITSGPNHGDNGYVFENDNADGFRLKLRYRNPTNVHSELMTVEYSGNVGIGTTAPQKKLHVQGATSGPFLNDSNDRPGIVVTGHYPEIGLFSRVNNTSHGPTLRLGAYMDANGTTFKHWVIGTAGQNASFLDIGCSDKNDSNPHAGIRNYNGKTVLTLVETGRVGIGTTDPQGGLDVRVAGAGGWDRCVVTTTNAWGDGNTQYVTLGAGGAAGIMFWNPHVTWYGSEARASIRYGRSGGVATGAWWDVGARANNAFSFSYNGTGDHKLWLSADGTVGIGTADPAGFKLRVAGDVRIDGVLKVKGYPSGTASVAGYSLEIGGPDPTATTGQATIFLHHHNKIAHQLRYASGTLYLEAAGNGYGTNPRPALALGGDVLLEGKHAFRGNDSWLRLNQDGHFGSGVYTPGLLRVDGDLQLSGKHAFRGNDSWLRLNQDGHFGSGVYTPGLFRVDGDLQLSGKHAFRGSDSWLRLNQDGHFGSGVYTPGLLRVDGEIHLHGNQFYAPGRMHINGGEICYILNKAGVIIGKEWGGNGNLSVQGSKNFQINHPLDPDRFLVHSVVEGPEAAVFYRGEAALVDGKCEIELPPYFEALARKENRTVLLTPKLTEGEETSALAAGGITDGKFLVRAIDGRNPRQRFYWEAKGVRADIDPIEVEPKKMDFPAPPRQYDGQP